MTEQLWCLACGTVTRDMLCDCNRWPDGHEMKREPNFVNYADEMQKIAHNQAQQIDALVKASGPFIAELARQERVRNYRDGDCHLVDCRITIGDLRRLCAVTLCAVTSHISQPAEKIEPSAS